MLKFVLQKLIHKKWMVFSLVIGNILLIAIAVSTPMYRDASLKRMLNDDMDTYLNEKDIYPTRIIINGTRAGSNPKADERFEESRADADRLGDAFGLPVLNRVDHYYVDYINTTSALDKDVNNELSNVSVGTMSDLKDHISIISGQMYKSEPDNGVIEAIVSESAFVKMNLIVGEEIVAEKVKDPDGNPLRLRISGVFKGEEKGDGYWVYSPNSYVKSLFIDEDIFNKRFADKSYYGRDLNANWFILLDYTYMEPEKVSEYLKVSAGFKETYDKLVSYGYREVFTKILTDYQAKEKKIEVTLIVLQIPVLVLLCSFIFMISGQMLELEQNEISILKSRGSGKGQIITVYLIQSLVIAAVGLAIGLPFGVFICKAVGSANAFLEFVSRRALKVRINAGVLAYGGGAALAAILAMTIPVIKYSNVGIVDYKRKKNKKKDKAFWQKMYLDVIILAVSLYGLYSFSRQKDVMLKEVLTGESVDPLLFISSSLFIIGAALVSLRILPLITALIYRIGKKHWAPNTYASFLQILRTGSKQRFIMVFIMLTVALGIFNASTARTILSNAERNLKYITGADIVLKEQWPSNESSMENNPGETLTYTEPDYSKFEEIPNAACVTKVYRNDNAQVSSGTERIKEVELLGIISDEFGKTANFEEDLFPVHPFNYLNAFAENTNAVIVSSNFENLGYHLGDPIYYQAGSGGTLMGVIYGFVDYFPTYEKSVKTITPDGDLKDTSRYLIVAHLAKIQEETGVLPYEVWIKLNGSSKEVYNFVTERDLKLSKYTDLSAEIVALKNDTVFQGTSGILTISFIVVLVLCVAGFLIYWILSIRSRELLFGIFRAMGMTMKEIVLMLVNEQIFISGLSICMGSVIGFVGSKLYIPLIQLAYSAKAQMVPLVILTESRDMIRLFAVVIGVLFICMGILGVLIKKINISKALKLGED